MPKGKGIKLAKLEVIVKHNESLVKENKLLREIINELQKTIS